MEELYTVVIVDNLTQDRNTESFDCNSDAINYTLNEIVKVNDNESFTNEEIISMLENTRSFVGPKRQYWIEVVDVGSST